MSGNYEFYSRAYPDYTERLQAIADMVLLHLLDQTHRFNTMGLVPIDKIGGNGQPEV